MRRVSVSFSHWRWTEMWLRSRSTCPGSKSPARASTTCVSSRPSMRVSTRSTPRAGRRSTVAQSLLAPGAEPFPWPSIHCPFISPEIGITGTPVIDAASRTMYVLVADPGARPVLPAAARHRHHHRRGAARQSGADSRVRYGLAIVRTRRKARSRFTRCSKTRARRCCSPDGNVYIAWGSSCDVRPYYGWVMAYDARTLKQTGVFNTSPDAGESGIWQADAGIAADSAGNVYAVTGNGKFTAASGGRDYGDRCSSSDSTTACSACAITSRHSTRRASILTTPTSDRAAPCCCRTSPDRIRTNWWSRAKRARCT